MSKDIGKETDKTQSVYEVVRRKVRDNVLDMVLPFQLMDHVAHRTFRAGI